MLVGFGIFPLYLEQPKASPVQGEVGCFSNPEGLLLTCGLDKNFLVGDKLDNPSDIQGIAKAIPLEKALARLMGGSHFASKDAKPHFFTLL